MTARASELSYAEETFWWLSRCADSSTYGMRMVFRIRGPLNLDALTQSLEEIVRRHQILTTTYGLQGGVIRRRQVSSPFRLVIKSLDDVTEAERESALSRVLMQEACRPFNLARGPLFRATLYRLASAEHVLQFAMHHIVCDGWSLHILRRELSALYGAACRGETSPLPPIAVQYTEFVRQQRSADGRPGPATTAEYWRTQLAGVPRWVELPSERPRYAVQDHCAGTLLFVLSAESRSGLAALGRRNGTTLFVVLLSILKILVHRLSGASTVVIGTPVVSRRAAAFEPLVGLFFEPLLLRTDFGARWSLSDLLRSVRGTLLGALGHSGLPWTVLAEFLNAGADTRQVVQVMFNMRSTPRNTLRLDALHVEPIRILVERRAKFDVMLTATPEEDGLRFELHYKKGLFGAARMQEFAGQFSHLVDQILAAPDRRMAQYSLATPRFTRKHLDSLSVPVSDQVEASSDSSRSRSEDDHVSSESTESFSDRLACVLVASPGVSLANIRRRVTRAGADIDLGRLVSWIVRTQAIPPGQRIAVLPGERDDVLAQGVLTALRTGGTMKIAGDAAQSEIESWLAASEFNVVFGSPRAWRRLRKCGFELPSLKWAFVIGDGLVREDVARVQRVAPLATCTYVFGREAPPYAYARYSVARDSAVGTEMVPVGAGIPGLELDVRNEDGELAGVGELGRLSVRDSVTSAPPQAFRLTGEWARYLPDGDIDCIGDARHVGSIQGCPVRFDEIAAALMTHSGVLDADVAATGPPHAPELVATVLTEDAAPSADELERFLRTRIPGALVPRRYIEMNTAHS